MTKPKYVEITKDGETGLVLPHAVPVWEKHGWSATEVETTVEPELQQDGLTTVDDGDSEETGSADSGTDTTATEGGDQ